MVTPKTVVICLVEAVIIGSIFSMLTLAGLFENVPSLVVAILLGGTAGLVSGIIIKRRNKMLSK